MKHIRKQSGGILVNGQVVSEKTATLHEAEAATAAHHHDFDTLLQSLLRLGTGAWWCCTFCSLPEPCVH